jgi:HAD superfamily hydrolase (TIGR01662 family)
MIRAVLFDVDFTLIQPGPMFRAEGYHAFCARYGIAVDPARFDAAVAGAASVLDGPEDLPYDAEIFVQYTRHIIESMGGNGAHIDACARAIYAEWASNHHFELYEDVPAALERLTAAGIRIGVISNSHRPLGAFLSHFDLAETISAAVSSAEHGLMKPHPSIFHAALQRLNVVPADAVMVGDQVRHDVEGALRAGLRGVFLHRRSGPPPRVDELAVLGVPTIRTLDDLPAALASIDEYSANSAFDSRSVRPPTPLRLRRGRTGV